MFFTSDRVAVRAILRAGFGFPNPAAIVKIATTWAMTMTTRKQQTRSTATESVTVTVVEPHLVFHDGEQRSGTLTGVPTDVVEYWERHGWVVVSRAEDKPAKPTPQPKPVT